jgi:hypothetical protein
MAKYIVTKDILDLIENKNCFKKGQILNSRNSLFKDYDPKDLINLGFISEIKENI